MLAVHSVSPSPSCSVVNFSSASSVSAYSPSAAPISLPDFPTADSFTPRDQVVTRTEFDSLKSLMITMASDLAAFRKRAVDSQPCAHSESVTPPTQVLPQSSVVDICDRYPSVNPMLLPPVGGGEAPKGESCPTLACTVVIPESLGLAVERGRKHFRELKDLPESAKRQRPPSRPSGSSPSQSADRLGHRSLSTLDASRVFPIDLSMASAPVPPGCWTIS